MRRPVEFTLGFVLMVVIAASCDGTPHLHDIHHRMSKRELKRVFDVDDSREVPPYDLLDHSHLTWTPNEKYEATDRHRLILKAFDDTYDILLTPHDRLVSPDLISIIRDGANSTMHHGLPYESDCHYRGVAISHENASVAFSKCSFMRGTIALPDKFLVLHPLPTRFHSSTNSTRSHVIFERAPSLAPNGASLGFHAARRWKRFVEEETTLQRVNDLTALDEFCDVNVHNETLPFLALRDDATSSASFGYGPLTLELALFLDTQLYQHFIDEFGAERGEKEMVDFSLALINNVYLLYQQPTMQPKLNLIIVRFELWKTQPEDIEGTKHKNGEAQLFLDAFCTYQAQLNPGNRALKVGRWDHATLLTGYDIYHTTSSVAGVAPVARMCDQVFSCSLVEGLHLGRSFVLAHEMGHNLGMVHDGVQNQCSRSCCLMSAVNGAGKTTWSPCSVRELNAYILSLGAPGAAPNCLTDGEHSTDVKDHKQSGLTPGQRFTADQQCAFFWGRDFKNEIPAGKFKSEICNILWCGNGGSTISTSHPALEGTWCGSNKWCNNGQCSNWPSGNIPRSIDGSWSQWTTTAKSVCSECKISAGVRVRKDIRGCDNPAPNNGGRECKGSAIRGILCDSDRASANKCESGGDKQKFADDICTALKDDGTAKGDTELSGKSFLHTTSPCKVWCHLADTKLIRNKGFFPDGSPCGIEKYCVDGECLELSCDKKALVFDRLQDCPKENGASPSASASAWAEWSTWTVCSETCGKGTRTRKRKCNGQVAACPGDNAEQDDCPGSAIECHEWSGWSLWTGCSVTCGQGTRLRTRDCNGGNGCQGQSSDSERCNVPVCPQLNSGSWSEWTAWSVCTKTCGSDGQRSRRRTCTGGDRCSGDSQQTESCSKKDCPSPPPSVPGVYSWNGWTPCSVTCGTGRQTRSRPCPFNSDPSLLVEHCLDGFKSEERECIAQSCPPGSNLISGDPAQWTEWAPCSVTCGFGTQTRSRACIGRFCAAGPSTNDSKPCFNAGCPSTTTAGPLLTARLSTIANVETGGGGGAGGGIWGTWAAWSSCSRSCGGGFRQRIRYCLTESLCPPSGSIQIDNCNTRECDAEWSGWSSWGGCSRTCGNDGQRIRTRRCLALDTRECNGDDKEAASCDSALPACNALIAHSQSSGDSSSARGPEWSHWSSWSSCSCFNDKSIRRRYCRIVQPNVLGFCVGSVLDERPCAPKNCTPVAGGWSEWSDWSACSVECISAANPNGAYRIRHRQCSEPFPVNRGPYCFGQSFEKGSCPTSLSACSGSAIDGGWSDWSSWSECSTSCNAGHKSRTRYCTNPSSANGGRPCQGLDFNLEVCQQPESCQSIDGGWAPWTSWSACTQSCGFAYQSRQRVCDSPTPANTERTCVGSAYVTRLCTLPQCPNAIDGGWSAWVEWSECSAQCGYGIRARTRQCDQPKAINGGTPCFGASTDVILCNGKEHECTNIDQHYEVLEDLTRKWETNQDR